MRYVIWKKSEPRFVIMQKAELSTEPGLTKVKVPVKLPTGTFMGYRYKKLGHDFGIGIATLAYVRDSGLNPAQDFMMKMLKQEAVDPELVGRDDYFYPSVGADENSPEVIEFNKVIQERYDRDSMWGLPTSGVGSTRAITPQDIKRLGAEYMNGLWKEKEVGLTEQQSALNDYNEYIDTLEKKYGSLKSITKMSDFPGSEDEFAILKEKQLLVHEAREDWKKREERRIKFGSVMLSPDDIQRGWATAANDRGKYISDLIQAAMAVRLTKDSYNESDGIKTMISRLKHESVSESWKNMIDVDPTAGYSLKEVKAIIEHSSLPTPEQVKKNEEMWPIEEETIKAANVFIDGVYGRTQEVFKEMGYKPDDTIILYRGVGDSLDKFEKGRIYTNYDYRLNPLSSWTADPRVAIDFGDNMMVAEVKVKDIWSGFFTGMGCKEESEFIVPASAVTRFKLFRATLPSWEELQAKKKFMEEEKVSKSMILQKGRNIVKIDEGLDGEWIRIVEIARKKNVSIEKAKKIFLARYKKATGMDYPQNRSSNNLTNSARRK